MLYHTKQFDKNHLLVKPINILVTNACNLNCGGCTQHCDLFQEKEKWFIPIEQLKNNIDIVLSSNQGKLLGIFGGEPTIHPKFREILELLSGYKNQFVVFTNGVLNKRRLLPKNVYWKNSHRKISNKAFSASLYAARDCYPNLKKYWPLARQRCWMWRKCWSIIYDNRAYLCEPAAALDRLSLGMENWHNSAGWNVITGNNPFAQTDEEIAQQAEKFCYRCGCCSGRLQYSTSPSIVTPTNYDLLHPEQ